MPWGLILNKIIHHKIYKSTMHCNPYSNVVIFHFVEVLVDAVDVCLIDGSPLSLVSNITFNMLRLIWINHCLEMAIFVMFKYAIIEHFLDLRYHMLTIRYLFIQSPHFLLHCVNLLHLIKHLLMLVCLTLLLLFYLSL